MAYTVSVKNVTKALNCLEFVYIGHKRVNHVQIFKLTHFLSF